MSNAAEVEEVEEQAAEQADGDQPDMTAEEMADLDAIAEEVEQETAPDQGEEEVEAAVEDTDATDGADSGADTLDTGGEHGWGDMYVGTLTTVSNAIIEEHGVEGAEPVEEELARQLHLDEYFDEWMASRGKADMPPEQGVLIGTTMFLVAVIGTKTDIPQQIASEADF